MPFPGQTRRTSRSFLFDPRFAIGVGLVAASVAGVVTLVSASDDTIAVYAARASLLPGDRVTADDLVEARVDLGDAGDSYLLVGALPEEGAVVGRAVPQGELVPRSALGAAESEDATSLVVTVEGELPEAVRSGSEVDVWAASSDLDAPEPPAVLVDSATVVRVLEGEGLVVDDSVREVELLVPRDRVARLLEALAADDVLSLLPVSIPLED